jgi:hypothetical protein
VPVAAVNEALLRLRERCHGRIRLQRPYGGDPGFILDYRHPGDEDKQRPKWQGIDDLPSDDLMGRRSGRNPNDEDLAARSQFDERIGALDAVAPDLVPAVSPSCRLAVSITSTTPGRRARG